MWNEMFSKFYQPCVVVTLTLGYYEFEIQNHASLPSNQNDAQGIAYMTSLNEIKTSLVPRVFTLRFSGHPPDSERETRWEQVLSKTKYLQLAEWPFLT